MISVFCCCNIVTLTCPPPPSPARNPHLRRSPVASVLEMRSEPARSIRLSFDLTTTPVCRLVPSTTKEGSREFAPTFNIAATYCKRALLQQYLTYKVQHNDLIHDSVNRSHRAERGGGGGCGEYIQGKRK